MRALQYKFSIPNYVAVRTADNLPLGMIGRGNIPGSGNCAGQQAAARARLGEDQADVDRYLRQ